MTRTVMVLVCICFASSTVEAHDWAVRHRSVTPAAAVHDQTGRTTDGSLLGLTALASIVEWISTLPRAFDTFVTNEQRQQLVRHLRNVAKGFASVNIDCEALAALAARSDIPHTQMDPDFKALLESIIELRKSILDLAADLGEHWRDKGSNLASELANLTRSRADLTNRARDNLLSGNRENAVKSLRAAAALAEEAHGMVIQFLSSPPPK